MFKALQKFFAPAPFEQEAHQLYVSLVEQARQPVFYSEFGVADTVDGRFDVIALHLFLAVDALRKQATPDALECARALTEVFVSDMDRSIREMGVTDTGTGKRVRRMAEAYYGREQAYKQAFDEGTIAEAVNRNLYRGTPSPHAQAVEAYMRRQQAALSSQPLLDGKIEFA